MQPQAVYSLTPLLAVLVSMIAGIFILFSDKNQNLRECWTFLAAFIKAGLVFSLYPLIQNGQIIIYEFFNILPGVKLHFRVDTLGFYFAAISSSLWIITSIYSLGYMRGLKEHAQTRFYFAFALSLSAAIGIAFAGDLITFFIFFELLTIATYPLVAHKETEEAIRAGRKYLVYSLTAAACLLFAITLIYAKTGSLDFKAGGMLSADSISFREGLVLFVLLIYGCGVKAALFPAHAWLPSAMVAPTPVTALLHAVAVVKAGAFGILRVCGFIIGPELMREHGFHLMLIAASGFTILGASMMALAQDHLKRRLAYSTISQLSYIILGAAIASPSAFTGSVLHLANHAMLKITLFFCAGAIYVKLHKEYISDMKGIAYKMPWTIAAFFVAAVGLSGFPPSSGFISKWFLCKGAIESSEWPALLVFLSSALLNLAYLMPVVMIAFQKSNETHAQNEERPWTLISPPVITGVMSILFGLIPLLIAIQLSLANQVSTQVFNL